MLPVAVALQVLLGSDSPADLGSRYKEEAIVSLTQAPSWNYSLFLKDEYISDSLSECGLRSSDPKPPFPITSHPGATLFYHLKPGGHSFPLQPWSFKSPRSFEQEQGWDICFK